MAAALSVQESSEPPPPAYTPFSTGPIPHNVVEAPGSFPETPDDYMAARLAATRLDDCSTPAAESFAPRVLRDAREEARPARGPPQPAARSTQPREEARPSRSTPQPAQTRPTQSDSRAEASIPSHQLTPDDVVIAVMGITGAGKTTFIQHFCAHDLAVGHGLESCTSKVEVHPCSLPGGRKFFLVDTPGYDDTYKSDTDILREIADWLGQVYQNRIKLTGIVYLHRISDVRIGGSGMKNLRMFRKLCGERGLGSVVLATTMWSLCPLEDARRREDQLINQNDLWKTLKAQGSKVFRQDNDIVSGTMILEYLIDRARPVTLDIQHEMVDQHKKLSETSAGREVQEELERMKAKHEQEMKEIRADMEQAIRQKDEETQKELREYREQINRQMEQAAEQARTLEANREQLRAEMAKQHDQQMKELKDEIARRQQEIKEQEKRSETRTAQLLQELDVLRAKMAEEEQRADTSEGHRLILAGLLAQIAQAQAEMEEQERRDESKSAELERELKALKEKTERTTYQQWNYGFDWQYYCHGCNSYVMYKERPFQPHCNRCRIWLHTGQPQAGQGGAWS